MMRDTEIATIKAYKIGENCYVSIYGFYRRAEDRVYFEIVDYDDIVDPIFDQVAFEEIKEIISATDTICNLADKIPELIALLPRLFAIFDKALVRRLKEWVEELKVIRVVDKDGQWHLGGD